MTVAVGVKQMRTELVKSNHKSAAAGGIFLKT